MRHHQLLCVALLAAGCVVEPELASNRDHLSFEDWRETVPRSARGDYILDDMNTQDEGVLRAIYDLSIDRGGELAIMRSGTSDVKWSASNRINLTYCIGNQFTSAQYVLVSDALRRAAAGWESAADVDFRHLPGEDGDRCTDSNTNVRFNVRFFTCDEDGDALSAQDFEAHCVVGVGGRPPCTLANVGGDCSAPFSARAFFPNDTRANRQILFGSVRTLQHSPTPPNSPAGTTLKHDGIYSTMRHELGHALGFVHEFARQDYGAPGCSEGTANRPLSPGPDRGSVMTYPNAECLPINWNYFTALDMAGVASVYGPPRNYDIVPADYNGDGITDMAVRAGRGGNWFIDYTSVDAAGLPIMPQVGDLIGDWDVVVDGYGSRGTEAIPGKFHSAPCVSGSRNPCASLAIRELATGNWLIDYAHDGFLGWDAVFPGYGDATSRPAIADYDGDGLSDMSIKDSSGNWYIDYSSALTPAGARYGQWNFIAPGYGNATALPVPADYDGDGRADLAIKSDAGEWNIDFSAGCAGQLPNNCFGQWNSVNSGYGNAAAVPVPADYDGDGRADLSVRDNASGTWFVDFSPAGGWNQILPAYGDAAWIPVPGKYHAGSDQRADFAIKRVSNTSADMSWFIDNRLVNGGYGAWDFTMAIKQ